MQTGEPGTLGFVVDEKPPGAQPDPRAIPGETRRSWSSRLESSSGRVAVPTHVGTARFPPRLGRPNQAMSPEVHLSVLLSRQERTDCLRRAGTWRSWEINPMPPSIPHVGDSGVSGKRLFAQGHEPHRYDDDDDDDHHHDAWGKVDQVSQRRRSAGLCAVDDSAPSHLQTGPRVLQKTRLAAKAVLGIADVVERG